MVNSKLNGLCLQKENAEIINNKLLSIVGQEDRSKSSLSTGVLTLAVPGLVALSFYLYLLVMTI